MRTAIYTRISNDPSLQGLGVQRQLDDCLALADTLGWEVVAHHDDNDVSAFSGRRRPGFEAMLTEMGNGDIDAVVCWHSDRLYRSLKDLERLIDVAETRGIPIRTVQGGDLDLSNSSGRMLARILGSVSRQESEHKGERQRRANDQRAAAGKWVSANRPFGYESNGAVRQSEAAMIHQAAADVLAGKSIRQVAREWRESGVTGTRGRPFTSPNVRRLLVNPRYAGINVHRGKMTGPGDWTAVIDADTHHGLVAHLGDPSRIVNTTFERKYIGSGVYLCGVCGGPMRHAVAGGQKAGRRRYECKTAQHVTRSGEPLDEYVELLVLGRLAQADGIVLNTVAEGDVTDLHSRRNGLQARLDELAGMFAEGAVDGSQLRRGTSELRTQLAGLDRQLAELSRTSPAAELLTAGEQLAERWAELTPDMKGKIVTELMTVTVLSAKKGPQGGFDPDCVRIEWR